MYKRIAVALDGSRHAEAVLPHVEALATKFGSAVTLVRATMPQIGVVTAAAPMAAGAAVAPMVAAATVPPGETVSEIQRRDALTYLGAIAHDLAMRNIDVEVAHDEGTAGDVILKMAKAVQADLVAMTTHGAGAVRRLVLGSVADTVLREAPCPILLVRIEQADDSPDAEAAGR